MINHGSLILSLDYELMWGCCEWSTPEKYGETNIRNVPTVIYRMLELFQKYNIRATFATVGLIMHENKESAIKNYPQLLPTYKNEQCSPYKNKYIENIQQKHSALYFDRQMVEFLNSKDNIEVATHTYCHYYCWEPGQTIEEFEADIVKAIETAKEIGIDIKSIVFPKNMVSNEYLKVCSKHGITSYRGNALKYFNEPNSKLEAIKNRFFRILDAYINIGGYTSIPYSQIKQDAGVTNIRASRMLRPYTTQLSIFEYLRLNRIKKEIKYAAKHKEMYHLWWHPHNFGANIEKNLSFLEKILQYYKYCNTKYNMHSYTMSEIENLIKNY